MKKAFFLICVICFLFISITPICISESTTYVALGASETVGAAANPVTISYSYLIRNKLYDYYSVVRYYNLGEGSIPGSKILSEKVPKAISYSPDIVTLIIGAQDLSDGKTSSQFSSTVDSILKKLNDAKIKVFVSSIPDLTRYPALKNSPNFTKSKIDAFNQVITTLAPKYNATVVDASAITP
jgi:lysophospholipase L1-like esterase